eukprot:scaffold271317_cov21-Tisochrysis_lutea.AAC.2
MSAGCCLQDQVTVANAYSTDLVIAAYAYSRVKHSSPKLMQAIGDVAIENFPDLSSLTQPGMLAMVQVTKANASVGNSIMLDKVSIEYAYKCAHSFTTEQAIANAVTEACNTTKPPLFESFRCSKEVVMEKERRRKGSNEEDRTNWLPVLPQLDDEDLVYLASAGPATQTYHEGLMQHILGRVSL